jgi:hypothetical protein
MENEKRSDAQIVTQLQQLQEIHGHIQLLRQLPPALLHLPTSDVLSDQTLMISSKIERIKTFGDLISSPDAQVALKNARMSAEKDKTDIPSTGRRRENTKRRYVYLHLYHICKLSNSRHAPIPDSPQPFIQMKPKSSSLFPTLSDEPSPIRIDDLTDYLREFNKAHEESIRIWHRNRASKSLTSPIVLRYSITDVLISFVTVTYQPDDPVLVVESFSASGSRENVRQCFFALVRSLTTLLIGLSRICHTVNQIISYTRNYPNM